MPEDFNISSTVDTSRILGVIRRSRGATRSSVQNELGIGRSSVTQRLESLLAARLISQGNLAPSTGGRAPREYFFAEDAGIVLVADVSFTEFRVAVTNLGGRVIASRYEPAAHSADADATIDEIAGAWRELLGDAGLDPQDVWGVGIAFAAPVEFHTGRPLASSNAISWSKTDVRGRFESAFGVPCWVDNDVNLMALAEHRSGVAETDDNVMFIKVARGVGAGLISRGALHRGASGSAGDLGHIQVSSNSSIVCVCGNVGCLSVVAGGWGIVREASILAENGQAPLLAQRLQSHELTFLDVIDAAMLGDRPSVDVLNDAGRTIGRVVAAAVNFYNPSMVVLGGEIAERTELIANRVREAVYTRSLSIATERLSIVSSGLGAEASLVGAAHMVVDELLAPEVFHSWFRSFDRNGRPSLTERHSSQLMATRTAAN